MTAVADVRLRETIDHLLTERNLKPVGDHESLFSSGLLDSLAATEVLILLELEYGFDLADEDFDIAQIDTLHALEKMIASRKAGGAGTRNAA
jgi:acyl carrier protein